MPLPEGLAPIAPPSDRFQPENLTADLLLPVSVRGVMVGDVPVRLRGGDLLGVEPLRLAQALESALREDALARLRSLGSAYAAPETLASTGLRVAYDPAALSLSVDADVAAFQDFNVFMTQRRDVSDWEFVEPARFAMGVDGSLLLTRGMHRGGETDARFLFDGFTNLGGPDGVYLDFAGRVNFDPHPEEEVLTREALTLFKDDRERAIRYSAIDVRPDVLPLLGQPAFLGLGVERRYSEIQPDRNVRPLGRSSLLLERSATVEVEVNGVVIQRFQAPAGPVNLADIPFVNLSNDVRIYVEDEFGRREVDAFTFSSQESLLAPGVSEFGLSGGAMQERFAEGVDWETDRLGGVGYYRRGITPQLTLGAGAAVAEDGFFAVTGNLVAALPYGLGQADVAWAQSEDSTGETRSGFAASARYDIDFEGAFFGRDQVGLRLDYQSEDFSSFGGGSFSNQGDLLTASGVYRMRLDETTSLNFGAGYLRDDQRSDLNLRLGASRRFGALSASAAVEHEFRKGRDDETRLFISASMPLGDERRVSASYSSPRSSATVELEKYHHDRVGEHGYLLRAEHDDGALSLLGRVDYIGNRFEAEASLNHAAEDAGALFDRDSPLVGSVRLSSGLAVADGRMAVGRRVGRGFLILDPHPTLADSTISVGDGFELPPLVRTDGLGPIVAPGSGDYRMMEVALNVEDAPLGYDFGSGVYATRGGARTGAVVTVGDDAFYSARGVLQDAAGAPVARLYGRLVSLESERSSVDLFTNASGVFFISGLAPGAYELEMAGERVRIDLAPPTEGALIDLGAVVLGGGA